VVVRKSSDWFGVAGPGEGMVALAATERAEVETFIFVEGGTLGNSIGTSNVPINAEGLVVSGDKTKTRAAFCPRDFAVSELGGHGEFEVEKNIVPPLCADEADGAGGRLATA